MAQENSNIVTLDPDQLLPLDEWILRFLDSHEWANPTLMRCFYNDAQDPEDEVTRQWFSNRVRRLAEHGHLELAHPDDTTHTYQLVSDPRPDDE